MLQALHDRNETLFYAVLMENAKECMPLIYTPTVGAACQAFGHIWRKPRGLYITIEDIGNVRAVLDNWYEPEVKAIVMTDGERILGLGDLGTYGMGIPIGKLDLYVVCGGVLPHQTLPIQVDVGTNNESLLNDEMYTGLKQNRVNDENYDDLIKEIFDSVEEKYGKHCLVQFEDFGNKNAFRLLEKYEKDYLTFNDDIQGTASVSLAGIFGSMRKINKSVKDQKFLIVGAGEAGIGIGDLNSLYLNREHNISIEEARKLVWFVDSRGLIYKGRQGLNHEKEKYAH